MMELNKKDLLYKQVYKIANVLNVLHTQFGGDYEDEINFLEFTKGKLSNS